VSAARSLRMLDDILTEALSPERGQLLAGEYALLVRDGSGPLRALALTAWREIASLARAVRCALTDHLTVVEYWSVGYTTHCGRCGRLMVAGRWKGER